MRHGARPLVPLICLLLLVPGAAAQAPTLEIVTSAPPLLKPGNATTVPVMVRYCYNTASAVPANVAATVEPKEWVGGSVSPESFRAEVAAGQRCGTRELQVTLRAGRDAPAFETGALTLRLSARGATGSETREGSAEVLVQAEYWAELQASAPPRVRVARGDSGTITLELTVGANDSTRLEVTGRDPRGLLNLLARIVDTQAGDGLDAPQRLSERFTVTVSPGADPGVHVLDLNVTSIAAQRPGTMGETERVRAEIEVTGGGPTPAPGAALLALGALAAALLARRRAEGPR